MGRSVGSFLRSEPLSGTIELFLVPSQCSMTGITKAVVCAILSRMMHIKDSLYISGQYVRNHSTI